MHSKDQGRSTCARALHAMALGALLWSGGAGAVEDKPVRELEPVQVNAIRDPEVRKYSAILAGLDAFDAHHGLAPAADRLRFRIERLKGAGAPALPQVRLVGDGGFTLPLPLDAESRFVVPRSDAAKDAGAELDLNQKRQRYRIEPDVRTPGLPPNRRRLGDLRLECQVAVAIGKKESSFVWVLTVNGILRTTDWCSFFDDKKSARFGFHAERALAGALLVEGSRSALLKTRQESFEVPIGDSSWSNDALVELSFAEPPTGTAGETPRTAP